MKGSFMQNPTRKPKAPRGYVAAWVAGYSYLRVVGRKRTVHGTYKKIRRRVVVPGHWTFAKSKVLPVVRKAKARRVKKITLTGWERAVSYEENLRREYDLAGADPIYRFNRLKDVVKIGGDFPGLVWDHPIRSNVQGDFVTGRVWYIAHHDTQNEYYLYVRTFQIGHIVSSLALAAEERQRWEAAILAEYEGKEYMAVERFVAWTVFDEDRAGKNLHQGKAFLRKDTKEKAYSTRWKWALKKPKTLVSRSGERRLVTREVAREMTPWEIKKVLRDKEGRAYVGLVLKKGESVKAAFKRMPVEKRRVYRRRLRNAIEGLEARWERERRGE